MHHNPFTGGAETGEAWKFANQPKWRASHSVRDPISKIHTYIHTYILEKNKVVNNNILKKER